MMKTSTTGLAIIRAFEGCHAAIEDRPGYFKAYYDPVGVLTIGYGHTNHHEPKITSQTVWSQKQCDEALARDIGIFERHVSRLAKVPLTQSEFDALVSWAYNTGGPATATVWKKLNAGEKWEVPDQLSRWNRGGGRVLNGLTRRRKAEAELFVGDTAKAFRTAQISSPPTDRPPIIIADAASKPQPSKWAAFFEKLFKAFNKA